MLVPLVILVVAFAVVLGRIPFAKAACRLIAGAVLLSVAIPCLVGTLSHSSIGPGGASSSSALTSALIVLLAVVVLVVIGRWSFKRWLASRPEPPVPTSSRRRVDLPELPTSWSNDRYKEDDL